MYNYFIGFPIIFASLTLLSFFIGYHLARKKYKYVQAYPCGLLSDLEKGDQIQITLPSGFLCRCTVYVNSPQTERIVLELPLEGDGTIYAVYDYSNSVFDDFEILNVDSVERDIDISDMQTIVLSHAKNDLRRKLEFFLTSENYEEAAKIRDEIKKLK